MKTPTPTLTPHELVIMKVVWELGQATVREVYERLREARPIAYTTVMTMMNVLERKKHLRRRVQGRGFVYRPTRTKQQVTAVMVRDFVCRVFDGSAQPLLAHLVEDRQLTQEDVDELARRIKEEG